MHYAISRSVAVAHWPTQTPSSSRAFSLPELMLALAVAGVLAMIAFPAYSEYRERARVSQAVADIAEMQVQIERFQTLNFRLPNTLTEAGLGALVDPWNRTYVFVNYAVDGVSGRRQDKNMNPINTEYDLYSKGKDGLTQKQLDHSRSLDDVVRATDGSYIGLASKF